MEYQIRSARKEDRKWIEGLYRQAKDEVGIFNPYQIWQRHLSGTGPEHFIVVEHKAVCVYYYSIQKKCYILCDIVVDREHRREGLGRYITEMLISKAKREGKPLMCKSVEGVGNEGFWQSLGFRQIGKTTNRSGVIHLVWII